MEENRITVLLVNFLFPCFSQDFLMVVFFKIKLKCKYMLVLDTKKVDTFSPGEISQMVNYNYSLLGGMLMWSEEVDLFLLGVTSQSLTVAASWKWSQLHQLGAGQTAHTPWEMVRNTLYGWLCEVNCIRVVLYFLGKLIEKLCSQGNYKERENQLWGT